MSGINDFTNSNYILRKYRTNNIKFTSSITASKPKIPTTMKEETTTLTTTKAQTVSKAKTSKKAKTTKTTTKITTTKNKTKAIAAAARKK
jgi:hypothetical protein